MSVLTRAQQSVRKNLPDLLALLGRRFPEYVYRRELDPAGGEIPAIVFHEIERAGFEEKLRYLARNGYATLDAGELARGLAGRSPGGGRQVALTFDDGHISLYRTAFPLLKEHGCRAVAFICPGLVDHVDETVADREMCSWAEIEEMHRSGAVDFQLHSLHHDLVFTSPKVVDFFRPRLTSPWFGKRDRAHLCGGGGRYSLTNIHPGREVGDEGMYGAPIFEHVPRYAARRRYEPALSAVARCSALAAENGGARFFETKGWRAELSAAYREASAGAGGSFVSGDEYRNEIREDLETARSLMEGKLPGKRVEHLCYPWYAGTSLSDEAAAECGFRSIHYGLDKARASRGAARRPIPVGRLSDEYFFTLPGEGKRKLLPVFFGRFTGG